MKKNEKKMKKKHWYVLAYDIREPKRLRRTHAYIRKHGVSLQKSVFLIHTDRDGLAGLKQGVIERVNSKEDDVRLYPVRHPGALWTGGRQAACMTYSNSSLPRAKDWYSSPTPGVLPATETASHPEDPR